MKKICYIIRVKAKGINRIKLDFARPKISVGTCVVILVFSILASFMFWFRGMNRGAAFDATIYSVKAGTGGITSGMKMASAIDVALITFVSAFVLIAFIYLVSSVRIIWTRPNGYKKLHYVKKTSIQVWLIVILFFAVFANDFVYYVSSYAAYARSGKQNSNYIAENYVDPNSVNITFPEQKRNLIYIYMESMENSYADKAAGGALDVNLIPNLTNLAKENINFSEGQELGGSLFSAHGATLPGVGWTAASLVSQTSGLPLKQYANGGEMDSGNVDDILTRATVMENVLNTAGYDQVFMCGSDSAYAGRNNYFMEHGGTTIKDWLTAAGDGIIPAGYNNGFWGMEDAKLYTYAKQELGQLSQSDEPFALTLLTVDTHFPDGWVDGNTLNLYDNRYENVIATSDKQMGEFLSWLQGQDFYNNTTIVIVGDHPTMDKLGEQIQKNNPDYFRTTYNCFINSAAAPIVNKGRYFCNFDMFPTVLASMGVNIDGNRLGLGTNLFSDQETLIEKDGFEKVAGELAKGSLFYENLQ